MCVRARDLCIKSHNSHINKSVDSGMLLLLLGLGALVNILRYVILISDFHNNTSAPDSAIVAYVYWLCNPMLNISLHFVNAIVSKPACMKQTNTCSAHEHA